MKKFQLFKTAAVAALALAGLTMNACSDSKSSSTKSAKFVDSAVIGISYKTSSGKEGVTGADGKFTFKKGDSVTFYIGEIEFPSVMPLDAYVTPAHIANTEDWEDSAVAVNIARFLQTLDEDGDLSNGIQIPEGIAELTEDLGIDFSNTYMFEAHFAILLDLIEDELGLELEIVSANDAKTHLKATIEALGITITIDTSACNMTELAGDYYATFTRQGAGPYEAGEHAITFGSDRSLSIGENFDDMEKVATFCSYSETTVDSGPIKITTETYTWVKGTTHVYALVLTGDTETLMVTVNQTVNGSFSSFEGPL